MLGPRQRLELGDRFPDFVLADQADAVRAFSQRARGNGIAVFLDTDAPLRASLDALSEPYQSAELDCVTLESSARDAGSLPCVLADGAGRIRQSLREMAGYLTKSSAPSPLAFLLDRNQRVLAVSDRGDLARWALDRWLEQPAPMPAAEISLAAPVLLVPNVLTPTQCAALIARWHESGNEPGHVTSLIKGEQVKRVYEDLKKRRDHVISDPAVRQPLLSLIGRKLAPELDKAFHYRHFKFDQVEIACYEAERGDYFRRHRDNQTPATAGRRFALTLNLNSDEYDGGELAFPEYGAYRYKPDTGAAVLFSCSLLHEALPVTRGQRFALVSFLRDAPAAGGAS